MRILPRGWMHRIFVAGLCLASSMLFAIGPHEVALVINETSLDSVLLGQVYQRLRSIPDTNVVRLSIPSHVYDGVSTDISPADFAQYIWMPMMAQVTEAGIRPHLLAVVYSCGFPTRVTTSPAMSITGLTFTQNQIPDSQLIQSGRYVSDLFAGSSSAEGAIERSATFDHIRNRLLDQMPLPAMMLAFTGTRGMSLAEAVQMLDRSAAADYSAPRGTFFFAVNQDVRSTCRAWQFEGVAEALRKHPGIDAVVSFNAPSADLGPLLGYMTGRANLSTNTLTFVPGAFAEHLTSFGAAFHRPTQTKSTEWLKQGAAFTAGTVDEPYAIWAKFPHAAIFLHAVSGCSAIESIYQSVLSPLQILPLGDPLSKPWAIPLEPEIEVSNEVLSGRVELHAHVKGEDPSVFLRFHWFVDGKPEGIGRTLLWNTQKFSNGSHRVRVVARRQLESVRHQGFDEVQVEVQNGGQP